MSEIVSFTKRATDRTIVTVKRTLSIVTYNILAQAYLLKERYPRSPAEAFDPAARRRALLDHLASFDADVYCLQEVERDSLAAIRERLGPGYQAEVEYRTDKPDGCAILSRTPVARFETFHYRAREPDGDQVAVIAHLRETGAPAIACTHLRWQPEETPPERHIGRNQMLELLDRAPGPSHILCGDMNALSESCVIRAALDRGLELACRASRPWDTVNINGRKRKLDYLLYTPATLEPRPRPLPKLERDTPMPGPIHPSDHLAVCIDFTIRD